jgi:hypothetical protein
MQKTKRVGLNPNFFLIFVGDNKKVVRYTGSRYHLNPFPVCFSGISPKGDKAPQNFTWTGANLYTYIARIIYVYNPGDAHI